MSLLAFALLPYLALVSLLGVPLLQRLGALRSPPRPLYRFVAAAELRRPARSLWTGAIAVSLLHLATAFAPGALIDFAASPARLLAMETTALVFGLLLLLGLVSLAVRAGRDLRVRAIAARPDALLLLALLTCAASGVWTALAHRWAVSWGAAAVAPYLESLACFSPDTALAAGLPFSARVHLVSGFIAVALLPFSGLARLQLISRPARRGR